MPSSAVIRPPALLLGDTVGIVAPAGHVDRNALEAGCARLRLMGYVPYYLDSIFERDLYFAGTVRRRVEELEHMFHNPEVRAIICARGGYGTNHLLPHLDLDLVRKNPKPFIGYSDNTTLLTWFTDHGLVTFHGPMVAKDFAREGGVDVSSWQAVLGSAVDFSRTYPATDVEPLVKGRAEGILYGGCLSLLVASLGTPYEIETEGKILFLEDLNERPFQVDRMLMQLKLAGKFNGVRGILFGEMLDCFHPSRQDYTLQEVVVRLLAEFQIPIAYGFSSGHVASNNNIIPIGIHANIDVLDEVTIMTSAAVTQGHGTPRAGSEKWGQ